MGLRILGGMKFPSAHSLVAPRSSRKCLSGGRALYKVDQVPLSRRHALPGNETPPGFSRVSLRGRGEEIWKFWGRGDEELQVCCGGELDVSEELQAGAYEGGQAEICPLLNPMACSENKRIFIFGLGYTSCALASYLKKNNWNVSGTCRSDEVRANLEQWGLNVYLFDSDNDGEEMRDDGFAELQQASHWLISVPPVADFGRDPVLATHIQDLRQAARKGIVGWIGYLSSTGVYGDWGGAWVDEESEPRPVEKRAVSRLAAEEAWLQFGLEHNVPVHVFRLGGIYGPGRSALNTLLQRGGPSGRQQLREQHQFTSRIHVADICQTVLTSMQTPSAGRIYNVVDDDPAPRKEVIAYAQDLLENKNMDSPSYLTGNATHSTNMASSRNNLASRIAEKRVSNKRIKQELQVHLLHPTFRSGLRAILEEAENARNSSP